MNVDYLTPDEVKAFKERLSKESEQCLDTKKAFDDAWLVVDALQKARMTWIKDYEKLQRKHEQEYLTIHIATAVLQIKTCLEDAKTTEDKINIIEAKCMSMGDDLGKELEDITKELLLKEEE